MADRNEVFRIILEGRDKISGTLGSVRKNVEGLDRALTNLKKGHEDFPLFGGGKAVRSSTGRFVKPEDLTGIDRLTFKMRGFRKELNETFREARKNEDLFPLIGGGTAGRGPGGRFQRVTPRSDTRLRESFGAGLNLAKDTEALINSRIAATNEEFKRRKQLIAEEAEQERVNLTTRQQAERTQMLADLRILSEEDEDRIDDLREARREADTEEEKNEIRREIRLIRFEKKERERVAQEAFTARFQAERTFIRQSANEKRRLLDKPDIDSIQEEAAALRAAALAADTAIARFGKRAGAAIGDVGRGFRSARAGMTSMQRDTNLLRNTFTRLGFAVGNVLKNFNQFVNLRWTFITGILTTFLTILTNVGAALIAVGASALQAAAALGGAFLAAVAQAAPAVGLLAAAFSRFGAVLDAVKLGEKLDTKAVDNLDKIRDAGQRLADSQWSLKQALQGVSDANFQVKESTEDLTRAQNTQREAVKNLSDAKIQAARDIVDANLEEKEAALSLKEAELEVLDAKKKLREEEEKKKKGAGDVDEARAAIREAQQRLQIARTQGDQAEISGAQQQLTIAEQNLSSIQDSISETEINIKEAKQNVERANLEVEQARVRNKRAREDAAKARREGVEGSDVVKQARDQLKDAIEGVADAQRQLVLSNRGVKEALHQVAVAHREVAEAKKEQTDAQKGATQASKDAAKAFADLSPSEKKLFTALKRIRKTFHDTFAGTSERDGILGPINLAVARFLKILEKMLRDPAIQKAARQLSQALGDGINKLADFVNSGGFKDLLIFFTQQATNNIPKIVEGMLNLLQTFLQIAKAATPIFNRLLDKFVDATGGAKRITQQNIVRRPEEGGPGAGVAELDKSGIGKFLDSASRNLDAWLKLGLAIGKVIIALTGSKAAGAGQTLIERLTKAVNDLANFINNNPEKVQKFFDDVAESVTNLFKILGRLGKALATALTSDQFIALTEVVAEILIPGLVAFLATLGQLAQILLFILDIPVVGDLVKWVAIILVVEKSFNKILPVTQKLTNLLKLGLLATFKALRTAITQLSLRPLALLFDGLRLRVMYAVESLKVFAKRMKEAAVRAGTAAKDAFARAATALGDMAKNAGNAAKAMGGRLIASLKGVAAAIGGQLLKAIKLLRISIRGLLLSSGIGALILAGVLLIENWDKVKKYAKILADFLLKTFHRVVEWVKNNWKKILVGALLAPFLLGGAILLGIYKFRDKILGVFKLLGNSIKDAFKGAFNWIRQEFTKIVDWIKKQYDKLPGPLKTIIRGAGKVAGAVGKGAGKVGDLIRKPFATGGAVPGKGRGDTVPAMLTPGEWVVNARQQKRLSSMLKLPIEQVKAFLFGTNMGGQRPKTRNNGRGKRVDTYRDFNLVQQTDDDDNVVWFIELANGSFGQVTSRDAKKIQSSNGAYIPGYVKRSAAGFRQNAQRVVTGGISGFSLGGIVTPASVQRFASGGMVQKAGFGNTGRGGNTVNQNFSVTTQGETDWGYVMRLGAVNANESF